MSEWAPLFLVVLGFYLVEGLAWLPPGCVAFSEGLLSGEIEPKDLRGAFRLGREGSVLPVRMLPWAEAWICQGWPRAVCPEGVLAGRWVPFVGATAAARGREVLLAGEGLFRAASPAAARAWADLLRELADLPGDRRDGRIREAVAASLDAGAARRRVAQARRSSLQVRVLCAALFLHLFAVLPVWIRLGAPGRAWIALGAGGLLAAGAWAAFLHAQRALGLGGHSGRALLLAVSPADLLHAHDAVTHEALAGIHPVAAARALCRPEAARALARAALREAEHAPAGGAPAEAWFRALWREELVRALARDGEDLDALRRAPAPSSPDSRAYCPRCEQQYALAEGACSDCGGVPLSPLSGSAPGSSAR